MNAHNTFKVPAGKLIKVQLDFDPALNTIRSVKIMGDFFVYPEEALEKIEQQLSGCVLAKEALSRTIMECIAKNAIEVYGMTPEYLADAILGCVAVSDSAIVSSQQ